MPATGRCVASVLLALLSACSRAPRIDRAPPTARGDTTRVVVLSLTSGIFDNTRGIRAYLPPGYFDPSNAARRYPVLYLNDGFAVFSPRGWNAPRIADSLIAARAIEPVILVGIDNAASIEGSENPGRDRANEYLPYPDSTEPGLPHPRGGEYPDFVIREVMPLIARTFRPRTEPSSAAVGGSSYGGIAALYTVVRYPGVFGSLMLESTPLFLFHERLLADGRALATWPGAVYVGIGTRETDDPLLNRLAGGPLERFVGLVRERSPGTRVSYNVVEGASHNAAAWRARLPTALTFLFGHPGG